MSLSSWFWLVMFIVLTAGCIRELRLLFATPEDRAIAASNTCKLTEEDHAADQEDR